MAKLTLNNVVASDGELNKVATINNNSDAIEVALEKTLSRDGTSPNEMESELDMNSNRILNLPAAVNDTEPMRKLEFDTQVANMVLGSAIEIANSAQLRALLSDETGTGAAYFQGGDIGTPSAGVLTNCTGLPNASVVGLGTAAVANTGTSGATVPLLNAAATWDIGAGLVLTRASANPTLTIQRTGTPGTGIFAGLTAYNGPDSAGNDTAYGQINVVIDDNTNGSEDGQFRFGTVVAGTFANRLYLGGGFYHPSATGTDKGNNTINFGAVYDDNSLLTCMAMAKEFIDEGRVDIEKWDALVPNAIEPEFTERVAVMEEKTIEHVVLDDDGRYGLIARKETATIKVQATDFVPIYDEHGNGIDALEEPAFDTIVRPAKEIVRIHGTARIFQAMLDSGFDPRDPEQYFAKMRADEALPGMPNQQDWTHNGLSIGEQHSRKWLAMEMLAIVCNVMWGKLKDHEARLVALEAKMALSI